MSRSKKESNPIALELAKYESKVKEFQDYLEDKPISSIAEDGVRHKEIEIQLKMMEKISFYLGEIKRLKIVIIQDELKEPSEIMGDSELSPLEQRII